MRRTCGTVFLLFCGGDYPLAAFSSREGAVEMLRRSHGPPLKTRKGATVERLLYRGVNGEELRYYLKCMDVW